MICEYDEGPTCANCHRPVNVPSDLDWHKGDFCWPCKSEKYDEIVKIVKNVLDRFSCLENGRCRCWIHKLRRIVK